VYNDVIFNKSEGNAICVLPTPEKEAGFALGGVVVLFLYSFIQTAQSLIQMASQPLPVT
jgi:hypothetical protein